MNIKSGSTFLINMLYSLGMFISALFITWWLLSAVDFLYPVFYQWLDIGATISEFGPQNRFKTGFEFTNYEQHVHYFSQIVMAINSDGQGLSSISYPFQGQDVPLLRDAEVRHLQDVGHLLSGLFTFAWFVMLSLVILLIVKIKQRSTLPTIKRQLLQLATMLGVVTVSCAIIGFKTVFYWLHDVIFPQENEWFFYYQDSLMTTMMQAPTLFAPISILLVVVTCLTFYALNLSVTLGCKRLVDFTS